MSHRIPFARPDIGEEEIAEVVDTLRSGWLTTGPKTRRFEEAFARQVDVAYALGTSSCTGALHLSLAALGVGPGDEVILPTLTFAATAHVIVQGRDCNTEVMAIAEDRTPLLGQVPLEMMDWWVDTAGQKLVGNPEHGGEWMAEAL